MGAVGHQYRDARILDPRSPQPIEYHGQNVRETRLSGDVWNDDGRRFPPASDVDQGRAREWLFEGGGRQPPCVAAGWSTRCKGADTKTAEVERQVVVGEREFDNHAVTIPSW